MGTTPRQQAAHRHQVSAQCSGCSRFAPLDLAVLIEGGWGDTLMENLPLRCSVCGNRRFSLIVEPVNARGREVRTSRHGP